MPMFNGPELNTVFNDYLLRWGACDTVLMEGIIMGDNAFKFAQFISAKLQHWFWEEERQGIPGVIICEVSTHPLHF